MKIALLIIFITIANIQSLEPKTIPLTYEEETGYYIIPISFGSNEEEFGLQVDTTTSANEILFALGKLKNAIEFEDLTKNDIEAKKSFGDMIKRCDEMKKKIDDFIQICKEFQVPLNKNNTFYDLNSRLSLDMQNRDKKFGSTYFDLVESEILKNSRKIKTLFINKFLQINFI